MKGKFIETVQHTPCKKCGAERVCHDYDDDAYIVPGILNPGCGTVSTFSRYFGDEESYNGETPPLKEWEQENQTCKCGRRLKIVSEGFAYGCVTRAVCEDTIKPSTTSCEDCYEEGHWI